MHELQQREHAACIAARLGGGAAGLYGTSMLVRAWLSAEGCVRGHSHQVPARCTTRNQSPCMGAWVVLLARTHKRTCPQPLRKALTGCPHGRRPRPALCMQGYRFAMPHSILMMHHPSGASRGQASEMHIESRELVRMRDYLSLLVSNSTGQPYDRVRQGGGAGRPPSMRVPAATQPWPCACVARNGEFCALRRMTWARFSSWYGTRAGAAADVRPARAAMRATAGDPRVVAQQVDGP